MFYSKNCKRNKRQIIFDSSLEKRYQDQIKALHADIDGERQQLSHLSSKQQRRLEKQIELLKEEEVQLKDKLAQTQQVTTSSDGKL